MRAFRERSWVGRSYPITSSAVRTAARVASETPGFPLSTRLTVASLTRACLATSASLPGTLQAYVNATQNSYKSRFDGPATAVRTCAARIDSQLKEAQMAGVAVGDFGSPDETRSPDKTTIDIVRMGGATASRMRLEPGWRWSECVKPVVGGESCQAHHVGLLSSGTMHVVHNDGTEQEIQAGQAYVIEPGHDAWVVGDDPVIGFEFDSRTAEEYARG
jgi:hypothetical protein